MATGEPENAVMIWKWSTSKVLVADTATFSVHHISFNPWDDTQLVCIGNSELNHIDFVEEELKLKGDTLLYHVGFPTAHGTPRALTFKNFSAPLLSGVQLSVYALRYTSIRRTAKNCLEYSTQGGLDCDRSVI